MLWMSENREAIATRLGPSNVKEIMKECGAEWSAKSDAEKKVYADRVAAMKDGTAPVPAANAKKTTEEKGDEKKKAGRQKKPASSESEEEVTEAPKKAAGRPKKNAK